MILRQYSFLALPPLIAILTSAPAASRAADAPVTSEVVAAPVASAEAQTAATATASVDAEAAAAPVAPEDQVPYRKSLLIYRTSSTLTTMNPHYNYTYNPMWGMVLDAEPYWWLNDKAYVRGSFILYSELTQRDEARDHLWISDLTLAAGLDPYVTIPGIEFDLSLEAYANLPTSQQSRARSLWAETGFVASFARELPTPVGSLTVGYEFEGYKGWYGYSSGAKTQELNGGCKDDRGCAIYEGSRNPSWNMENRLMATLKLSEELSVGGLARLGTAFLYGGIEDDRISFDTPDPTGLRYYYGGKIDARYKLSPSWTMSAGLKAMDAQLAPDGTYRLPMFNRNTQFFLEVRANLAALAAEFS